MATQYPSNRSYEPEPGIRRDAQQPRPRSATRQGTTRQGATRQGVTRQGVTRQGVTRQGATRQGVNRQGATRTGAGRSGAYSRGGAGGSYRTSGRRAPQGRPQPGRRTTRRRRGGPGVGLLAALAAIAVLLVLVFVIVKPFSGRSNPVSANVTDTRTTVADAGTTAVDSAFAGVEDAGEQSLAGYDSLEEALADQDADVGSLAAADMATVSDLSINTSLPSEWLNVLLLGTDARSLSGSARTDTMMICSINRTTGEVKLASIQRDLAIDFTPYTSKYKGTYRINATGYFGGPKLAMKVVNEKFGMNIQYYVMVNFFGFQRIAQQLGGVDIDITEEEMNQINKWAYNAYKIARAHDIDISDLEYEVLETYGPNTHLNGTQALGYARIRKMDGGDYMRTERQRTVVSKLAEQVKKKNALEIATLATSMIGYVQTNLELNDIINTAMVVAGNGISGMETLRLPIPGSYSEERREKGGAMLWDCDFASNTAELYNFIYE